MGIVEEFQRIIYDLTHWEKQYPGGEGIYHLFEIDLSEAREDKMYPFDGDRLIVTNCEAQAYLRLNGKGNDLIDLKVVRNIGSRFKEFYITNSVSAGKILNILAGANGIFNCNQPQIVDIALQNLSRVVTREHDGIGEGNVWSSKTVTSQHEYWFKNLNDTKGCLRYVIFYINAQTESHKISPRIYIDNKPLYPFLTIKEMDDYGFDTNCRPFQLLKFSVDGICACAVYFEKGLVFDSDLDIGVRNASTTDDVDVNCGAFWQELS